MKSTSNMLLTTLIGTALLAGCATTDKMDQPTYERHLAKARDAISKSDAVRYTWTNSENAMEKAEEAAKNGDWATAIKQAKLAREFSVLAYRQYEREKNSVPILD